MIYRNLVVFLIFASQVVSAQDENTPDPEVIDFSNYMSDLSFLSGMFDGVLEHCREHVSKSMADRSASAWQKTNGVYIAAIDDAMKKLVLEKVSEDRRDSVTESLKVNIKTWYQGSYENSKMLMKIKESKNKSISCAESLGSLNSNSFDIEKIAPAAYSLWKLKLKES